MIIQYYRLSEYKKYLIGLSKYTMRWICLMIGMIWYKWNYYQLICYR